MGRLHSHNYGKSHSTRPLDPKAPSWIKQDAKEIEETIVNVVKNTMIQGYEMWEKAVYETPNNQYRVYVGLKMGVGDANRLAVYIAKHANADINVDELAKAAVEKVIIEKVE